MKNIIFIAPPAAGKGTQSEFLVEEFNYEHISTGDILRDKEKDGSDLGNHIKELLAKGSFVSDDIVTELLKQKLSSINKSFILDGYPRNINQAMYLDKILKELNLNIDVVFYLNVDSDTSMKRALGRIGCPECGKIYNKYDESTKPIKDNTCDDCKVSLVSRSDDNEESFKHRYDEFVKRTKPLLDYYKNKNKLFIIDKVNTPEETYGEIKKVIL